MLDLLPLISGGRGESTTRRGAPRWCGILPSSKLPSLLISPLSSDLFPLDHNCRHGASGRRRACAGEHAPRRPRPNAHALQVVARRTRRDDARGRLPPASVCALRLWVYMCVWTVGRMPTLIPQRRPCLACVGTATNREPASAGSRLHGGLALVDGSESDDGLLSSPFRYHPLLPCAISGVAVATAGYMPEEQYCMQLLRVMEA